MYIGMIYHLKMIYKTIAAKICAPKRYPNSKINRKQMIHQAAQATFLAKDGPSHSFNIFHGLKRSKSNLPVGSGRNGY